MLVTGLQSCREVNSEDPNSISRKTSIEESFHDEEIQDYAKILAPLIDHQKLDSLNGERAATPRLRKASYWLEIARRDGCELNEV